MRGGLQRWKRGANSHGVTAAISYALKGECDATPRLARGVDALAAYSGVDGQSVTRYTVCAAGIQTDSLSPEQLRAWVDGQDPETGERRGRDLMSPQSDLLLDGTINAPKSFSLVALVHPDLAVEFEALQDRLRDRVITMWQRELNARRGAGGRVREGLARIEVVELQHRRSRALDPHIHRHVWLNVRVLGEDGQWSNVDSRVAMKLHTMINAEGDLAARTDPQWIAALARHGYTLDGAGEVTQVAHAVRPLSRRSNQIEANRAVLLAKWHAAHPGANPDRDALAQIDRLAWAKDRPRKPVHLDEDEWAQLVRDELEAIDPGLLTDGAGTLRTVATGDLDIAHLAEVALVDADSRAAANSGRFSAWDVRAGAMRAVAASGIVAERDALQPLIEEVIASAHAHLVDLLDEDAARPAHIKGYMASTTCQLKRDVAALFDALSATDAGVDLRPEDVTLVADATPGAPLLEADQAAAVGAVAGTHRLVAVTGPAGTGKTTLLRVAKRALDLQRRRMVVVAPTKKAASVAGREIGAASSSLHALLADHGWRWGQDAAGAPTWTRLKAGETDETGRVYPGPRRFPLAAGDRIVADEAGMVDLHTARALAMIAADTGAGIAMIGDHLQAMPVGHSGAMGTLARRAGSLVELSSVHRFKDPEYGALTLRLREPESRAEALAVARELQDRGSVHAVTDRAQARDVMVEAYFRATAARQRIALITATNDEADAINDAIQQRRLDAGDLHVTRVAVGAGEQRILEGDIVQTRRNDRIADVENRALWTVRRITSDGLELASLSDSTDLRAVTADYAVDHVQLAYASTVHGIQGETTDLAVVGPDVDAAGLYVGLTRGRLHNEAIAVTDWQRDAVEVIADTMLRGRPELTIDDSRAAARRELARAARAAHDDSTPPYGSPDDELVAWMHEARAAADGLLAGRASRDAAAHGRTEESTGASPDGLEELLARLDEIETARLAANADVPARSAMTGPGAAPVTSNVGREAGRYL